jgi:hypothetical protein
MAEETLTKLVGSKFTQKYVTAVVGHYQKAIDEFQLGNWEDAIAKSGKFIEAVLKALWAYVGEAVPTGKAFKAGSIIDGLGNKPAGASDDTVRLTIPRACRLVYDIASNRGGRHDAGEVDPNQMDASLVVSACSWILAEMLRFSQKGAMDLNTVAELVGSLNERKFPFTENINGRHYFSFKGLSARDVELLTLWSIHPRRMSESDLIATAKRHGNSEANAKVGLARLRRVVDDDGNKNLRLLVSGVQEAEALMASKRASAPTAVANMS